MDHIQLNMVWTYLPAINYNVVVIDCDLSTIEDGRQARRDRLDNHASVQPRPMVRLANVV